MYRKVNLPISFFVIILLIILNTPLFSQQPELIPRRSFFGADEEFGHSISPDGKMITYRKFDEAGVQYLWAKTPGEENPRKLQPIRTSMPGLQWTYNNKHMLYIKDNDGDENFHFYSFNIETGETRDLTPYDGVKAQNILMEQNKPDEILVGMNKRDKRIFDMYRINLNTGEIKLDTKNPGDVRWWTADHDLNIRAYVSINAETAATTLKVRDTLNSPWRVLFKWPFGETGLLEGYGSEIAVRFARDGNAIYVQSAFEADIPYLAKVDVKTGAIFEKTASDPKAGLWDRGDANLYSHVKILFRPGTDIAQAAGFNYLIPEWRALNDDLKEDFEILKNTHGGVFDIVRRDNSGEKWIVRYFDDNSPGAVYYYNSNTNKAVLLAKTQTHLNENKFSEHKPILVEARDGVDIPCYLTLPKGLPAKDLPLIMYIHGGPYARDNWGYNFRAQFLANRGYAVIQVNYRGSTGFGKKYLNSAIGGWGVGIMQNDISDTVHWAISEGIADPEKVGILGGSYGGYATLAGVTFTPDLYKCGVAAYGISSVKTFIETMPDWWLPIKGRWLKRIGYKEGDDEFAKKMSPFYHVERIKSELMIIHGTNDPRVKIEESNRIVANIRKNNGKVTYLVFPDEGHGIAKNSNFYYMLGMIEEFLAEHLGGRFEPLPVNSGTSAQIRNPH